MSFKVSLTYLLPQTWLLLLTGILSLYLARSGLYFERLTVFPETPTGASLNSLAFLFPLLLAATLIYLVVRSGHITIVKFIVRFSLVSATFLLSTWYLSKLQNVISMPKAVVGSESFLAIISACLTAIMVLAVYKAGGLIHAFSSASIGALLGTFLAFSIPLLSAITLLGALVVYDILSVYRGPIGRLVGSISQSEFTGAVFNLGEITIGMGDMVFYSMLASVAFSNYGFLSYAMSSLGVLLGAYLGMRILEKRSYLPGLPLAITAGLIMMLASILLTGQVV
jgi:hypothetical protein